MGYAHIDGEIEIAHQQEARRAAGGFWGGFDTLPGSAQEIAQQQMATKCQRCGSANVFEEARSVPIGVQLWRVCRACQHQGLSGGTMRMRAWGGGEEAEQPVVKDRTKARFDLIPWGPVWAMAETFTNGAKKPGRVPHNWRQGTNWSDYYGALMRHATLYQQGEDFEIDPDTGEKQFHLAAVMACAAILLEYQMFGLGTDDRFPAGHPAYKGINKWLEEKKD